MHRLLSALFVFVVGLGSAFGQGSPRTFDTVAEMTNQVPTIIATGGKVTVVVRGLSADPGGVFYWGSSTTNDVDGTNYYPANVSGRWVRASYWYDGTGGVGGTNFITAVAPSLLVDSGTLVVYTNSTLFSGILPPLVDNALWMNEAWRDLTGIFLDGTNTTVTITNGTVKYNASAGGGSSVFVSGSLYSAPNFITDPVSGIISPGVFTTTNIYFFLNPDPATNFFTAGSGMSVTSDGLKLIFESTASGGTGGVYANGTFYTNLNLVDDQNYGVVDLAFDGSLTNFFYTLDFNALTNVFIGGDNVTITSSGTNLTWDVVTSTNSGTVVTVDGGSPLVIANFSDNSEVGFGASGSNVTATLVDASITTNKIATAFYDWLLTLGGGGGVTNLADLSDVSLFDLSANDVLTWNGTIWTNAAPIGDVTGPASSLDTAVAIYSGTSGKTIQNSGVTISSSTNLAVPGYTTGLDAVVANQYVTLSQLQNAAGGDFINFLHAELPANGFTMTGLVVATNWMTTTIGSAATNAAATATNGQYIAAFISTNTFTDLPSSLAVVEVYCFENSSGSGDITAELYIVNSVTMAEEFEMTPSPAYQTVPAGATPTLLRFSIPVSDYSSTTNLHLMVKFKVQEAGVDPTIRIVTGGAYPSHVAVNLLSSAFVLKSGDTMTGDLIVPTEVYDSTGWDADLSVPTKDAVRDKIESLTPGAGNGTNAFVNGILLQPVQFTNAPSLTGGVVFLTNGNVVSAYATNISAVGGGGGGLYVAGTFKTNWNLISSVNGTLSVSDVTNATYTFTGVGSATNGYLLKSVTYITNLSSDAEVSVFDFNLPGDTLSEDGDELEIYVPAKFLNNSGSDGGYTWRLSAEGTEYLNGNLTNDFASVSSARASDWRIRIKRKAVDTISTIVTHAVGTDSAAYVGTNAVYTAGYDEDQTLVGLDGDTNFKLTVENSASHASLGHTFFGYTAVKIGSAGGGSGDFIQSVTNDFEVVGAQLLLTNTLGSGSIKRTRTGVTREIWIPANAMNPGSDTPTAATNAWATTTDGQRVEAWDFSATSTNSVYWTMTLPDAWNASTVKAKIHWKQVAAEATSTNVWAIGGGSLNDGETGGNTLGTLVTITDVGANDTNVVSISSASSAITIGGTPSAGHMTWFTVRRHPGDAGDNSSVLARLLGVQMQYTETAIEPSAW